MSDNYNQTQEPQQQPQSQRGQGHCAPSAPESVPLVASPPERQAVRAARSVRSARASEWAAADLTTVDAAAAAIPPPQADLVQHVSQASRAQPQQAQPQQVQPPQEARHDTDHARAAAERINQIPWPSDAEAFMGPIQEAITAACAERDERIADLRKYDAELSRCTDLLGNWPLASGCNGHLCVAHHLEQILGCVAELEQQLAEAREAARWMLPFLTLWKDQQEEELQSGVRSRKDGWG